MHATRGQAAWIAVLVTLGCARTDTAEKRPTRPTSSRTLLIVKGSNSVDPALAVPGPATEALRKHVRARLSANKALDIVPDSELTAIKLRTPACADSLEAEACRAEIEKGTAPDVLIEVTLARQTAKDCSLSVGSQARRAGVAAPLATASSDVPCALNSILSAADALLKGETAPVAEAPKEAQSCESRCEVGEKSCKERGTQTCEDGDWDGCNEWVTSPCSKNQGCSRGSCIDQPADMAFVPEGPFRMGSAPEDLARAMALCRARKYDCSSSWWKTEQPAHWVSLSGFFIDKTEVSNAEYEACVQAGACKRLDVKGCRGWDQPSNEWKKGAVDAAFAGPQRPAVCVTHDDARAFCTWKKKRLPTEAEWEKAARGTDGRLYPWGNDPADGSRTNGCDKRCGGIAGKGWRFEAELDDQHPLVSDVGSFPRGESPYGVRDMSGNVWEWVADRYSEEYYTASERQDPKGASSGTDHVVRGGSWSNEPDSLRAAYRYSLAKDTRLTTVGFRCAAP